MTTRCDRRAVRMVLLSVLAPLFYGCGSGGASPPTPSEFWAWVVENREKIREIRSGREPVAIQLGDHLDEMDDSLTWEVGVTESGDREMVISAGGVKAAIPAVERLIEQAPDLPGWKFTAFRQRGDPNSKLSWNGVPAPGDEVRVQTVTSGGRVHVRLYLPVPPEATDQAIGQLAFLHLDNTLGELEVMRKIGQVKFSRISPGHSGDSPGLPPEVDSERLITLEELRVLVDALENPASGQ